MELWVGAAAAGAGYLAKFWNRVSKISDSSSHLSSEDSGFENHESPRGSFRGQEQRDRMRKGEEIDSEKVRNFRNYNEGGIVLDSELPVTFIANENYGYIEDENKQSSSIGDDCGLLLPDSSAGEVCYTRNPAGNKACLWTKHMYGNISRPLNSLESCLVAQLYKEHAGVEENGFSSHSSASRATRSFLVSDGSRRISRANGDDSSCALIGTEGYKLCRDTNQVKDKNVLIGVPALPMIGLSNDVKMSLNTSNKRSGRMSSSNGALGGKHVYTQHDATFLFCLGISFGIITAILESRREMDKLRELLKQNENLVQDLQEELDMKDSMTVKELHSANFGSQDTCNHSFCDKELSGFSSEKHMENSPIVDCKQSYDQKEEENSESMSKIEAELEAELERLGLNLNESSLDRRLSELVELDSDFEAHFAQGELRANMVSGEDFVGPKSNDDASDPTPVPVNYAVSPHELSLRLHEVIQSRLEERVQELEVALQNSERKLRVLESGDAGSSQKYFPSSGQASSFTKGTTLTYDDCDPIAEPQVMNLSGEGLGAYNEAYEESMELNDSEENSPLGTYDADHKGGSHSHDWHVSRDQHGGANDPVTCSIVSEERLSRELSASEVAMLEGQRSSFHGLNDFDVSEDEDCDNDSETERQLIRQIVERTKKGSPVLQNARRILYSMDDDDGYEH